jgi:hypothetical protein
MPKKSPSARVGTCTYCGAYGPVTDDHVIPRNLFPVPRPRDMIKVDACSDCNSHVKSPDDEFLAEFFAGDMQAWAHPVVRDLLFPRLEKNWNKSRLVRQVKAGVEPTYRRTRGGILVRTAPAQLSRVNILSPGGIHIGTTVGVTLPAHEVLGIIERMIRGLYRYFTGERLEIPVVMKIHRITDLEAALPSVKDLVDSGAASYNAIGDSTIFNSIHYVSPKTPGLSLWYLGFYSNVVFRVITNPIVSQESGDSEQAC